MVNSREGRWKPWKLTEIMGRFGWSQALPWKLAGELTASATCRGACLMAVMAQGTPGGVPVGSGSRPRVLVSSGEIISRGPKNIGRFSKGLNFCVSRCIPEIKEIEWDLPGDPGKVRPRDSRAVWGLHICLPYLTA